MRAWSPGAGTVRLVPFFRRRPVALETLLESRRLLLAELDAAEEQAAWLGLGDEEFERAEGRRWAAQAEALRSALTELEVRILRAQIDAGPSVFDADR